MARRWLSALTAGVHGLRSSVIAICSVVMTVDVVCDPLLTLVVFNPQKPRQELFADLSLVVTVQLGALAYGVYSVASARPTVVAYEIDRFCDCARRVRGHSLAGSGSAAISLAVMDGAGSGGYVPGPECE